MAPSLKPPQSVMSSLAESSNATIEDRGGGLSASSSALGWRFSVGAEAVPGAARRWSLRDGSGGTPETKAKLRSRSRAGAFARSLGGLVAIAGETGSIEAAPCARKRP